MTQTKKETITRDMLAQFTGDLVRFRHSLNRAVIYTPGVQFLGEQAGAYWLIDAIASSFGGPQMERAIRNDHRLGEMQFWRLIVHDDDSAVLTARADSNEEPFITQDIPYTDFSLTSVEVWAGFDGTVWTLYLPSEH